MGLQATGVEVKTAASLLSSLSPGASFPTCWPMTSFHQKDILALGLIYISAAPHLEKELLNLISQELSWLPHGPPSSKDIKDVSVMLLVFFFPNSASFFMV